MNEDEDTQKDSKPYLDRRDAPVRRYLLNALAGAKLNGTELSIILVVMDQTYGWQERRGSKRRKDRAHIPISTLAEITGRAKSTISRYVLVLEEKNILTFFEEKSGPNSRLIGIQSDPDKWKLGFAIANSKGSLLRTVEDSEGFAIANSKGSKERTVELQQANSKGSTERTLELQQANPSVPKERTLDERKPAPALASPASNLENLDLNLEDQSDGEDLPEEFITDWRTAIKLKGLSRDTAFKLACKSYLKNFGRFLTPKEKTQLAAMMNLGTKPEGTLAVWLRAIDKCNEQRATARGEGKKTWRNIFLHVADCFSQEYESIKNGKKKSEPETGSGYAHNHTFKFYNPLTKKVEPVSQGNKAG